MDRALEDLLQVHITPTYVLYVIIVFTFVQIVLNIGIIIRFIWNKLKLLIIKRSENSYNNYSQVLTENNAYEYDDDDCQESVSNEEILGYLKQHLRPTLLKSIVIPFFWTILGVIMPQYFPYISKFIPNFN